MDSRTWWYILKIKPHACNNDILKCRWINEWDLYIEFVNR